MFFHLRDLELRPAVFDVELAPGEVEFLDPKLNQTGPMRASGKVELTSGSLSEIRASGNVTVDMEGECDRCLDPARFQVHSEFSLDYRPAEANAGDEKLIDPEETEVGFYDGDGLELRDLLREQVLLALPMRRLCSEDCSGLCPVCGQNRNQNRCECQPALADDRWSALSGLKRDPAPATKSK